MKVKIKKLSSDAVIPFKNYKRDFCYDCVATSCEEVAPNIYKYGLGFGLQINKDEINDAIEDDLLLGIDLRPRSSIWKTGMILSNSPGTGDELYTGQYYAVFYHIFPDMPKYEVGDRICQIKIGITGSMEFEEVNELSETERGTGGYGSTNK